MSQPPIDDSFDDRIQQILNEKKKENLRKQYGMLFEGHSDDMSPQAEGEWLDYITEFERQFENSRQVSVRERIGNPEVKPLTEIPDSEMETELDHIFELLDQHNIAIDFLHEQDIRETYRFIAEELLDEMTDDIHIPGMVSHFIYEKFHPNDDDDITQAIDEVLYALFKEELRDHDSMWYAHLCKESMCDTDGNPLSLEDFKALVNNFYEAHPVIMEYASHIDTIMKDGEYATAKVHITWQGMRKDKSAIVKNEGLSEFKLTRSVYGGWDIIQAAVPGWSFKK